METKRSKLYVQEMIISILETNLNLEIHETKKLFSQLINKIPVEELVTLPKLLIRTQSVEESTKILKTKALGH
jgi:hypothetical protein